MLERNHAKVDEVGDDTIVRRTIDLVFAPVTFQRFENAIFDVLVVELVNFRSATLVRAILARNLVARIGIGFRETLLSTQGTYLDLHETIAAHFVVERTRVQVVDVSHATRALQFVLHVGRWGLVVILRFFIRERRKIPKHILLRCRERDVFGLQDVEILSRKLKIPKKIIPLRE